MIPLYDVFRAMALVVGFVVGLQDRKTSMFADMVFTGFFGAGAFLCPQWFLGLQTTEKIAGEPLLMFICRVSAACLVSPLLMWYFCRKSRDDSVIGALLWSRVLGFIPLLMVMLYGHLTYTKVFIDRHMYLMMTLMVCIWVSNIVQLLRTQPSVGRREQKGIVSTLCRVNFLLLFLVGLAGMAFPKMIMFYTDLKSYHLHFIRVIGALHFSMTFLAWYAPSFRDNEDRKTFFYCELLVSALSLAALLYAYFGPVTVFDRKQFLCILTSNVPVIPVVGLLLMRESENSSMNYSYNTRSKAA